MFLIVTVPGFALHWYPYTTAAAAKSLQSHLNLCDPMTAAHQAPLPLGFCRQEYWSGFPFPAPGDPPDPGIEPTPLMTPALGSLPLVPPGTGDNSVILGRESTC